jgi:PAS domain S-box-containing protein
MGVKGKNLNSRLTVSDIKYHSVFNHSFDGVLLTSPDGRIIAANPAACRMFGRSEEELCRLGRTGIMNTNDPRIASALEQRELTGRFAGELTGLKSDGTVFPVELTTSVFTDSNGEKLTSMIIRDISYRNKTVEELEAKEAALRAILENTDSLIWSVDRHFRYLYGNSSYLSSYESITGRRIMPGDDVTRWLPEDQQEKWRGYLMQGISGISFTTMSSSGTGNQRQYMRFSFNPVRSVTGEVTGVTVMGTDVTDLMLMQKDLVRTGVMLREAQSVAKLGNWEYDVRLNRADWSDELNRIFGMPEREGDRSWESHLRRMHPDDRQLLETAVRKAYSEGIPFNQVFRLQIPGEEIKWVNMICKAERDRQHKVVRLYGTLQDQTERKKYEEALERSGETLRRLNMHIEEAREKERTEIAMNLHDDLGQKLTALKMNLSWLRKRIGIQSPLVSDKMDEVATIIKSSIDTVQKISSDLRPAILYELGLKDAVEWHMQQNLEPAGIKGSFVLRPEDLQIDKKSSIVLFRIIQEALTNIIRHSGADRAEIRISGFLSYAELVIRDNGKGIEPEAVNDPKSFGITSIKERVRNCSGQFRITGEKGKGTILIVRIPLNLT